VGWCSASDIFNQVADSLIETKASDEIKHKVLGDLCDSLQGEDWDCEYDSLDKYADDPIIVQVFADHGVEFEREGSFEPDN
jgi:hypothetical protein